MISAMVSTASAIRGPWFRRKMTWSSSCICPFLIDFRFENPGMRGNIAESRGAGSGAGVIVNRKSGSMVSNCYTEIWVKPGNVPLSGKSAAGFDSLNMEAIAPGYDCGFAE